MKKILSILFALAIPLIVTAQTNKLIRESDLKAYYDSTYSTFGGANLEPELVVTPAESKIVMDVDSVRVTGDLKIEGALSIGAPGTGVLNLAIGSNAMKSNTTGQGNVSIGANSMYYNTTGYYNLGLGYSALFVNSTGIGNVAIGESALYHSVGNANTSVGTGSSRNTTGAGNTVMGNHSLHYNTTGAYNIAIGLQSLYGMTSGSYNIGIGFGAGNKADEGFFTANNSIYIGYGAKISSSNTINEIVIGNDVTGAGNNTVTLGNSSIIATYLFGNVNIGDYTMPSVDGSSGTVMKTDGDGNLYWGSDIYGGGGGIGGGHADSLRHLNRIVPGDSVVTYADLYSINNTTSNVFTVGSGAGAGANKIALGSTANTIGATATIKPAIITSNITLTLPAITGTLALTSNVSDSNFVLTSETSAWDKNGSNDRLLADTTGNGGNTATRYQLTTGLALKINKSDSTAQSGYMSRYDVEHYSNASYHVGQPGYGSINNFITDGNQNWNNEYGYITGISANYITESMLKATNSPTDEYVLTYEGSGGIGGDLEWQVAGSAVGDTSIHTLAEIDTAVSKVLRGIDSSGIKNGTVAESDLEIDNLPVDEYVLTYEVSTGNLVWEADETGGAPDSNTVFLTVYDAAQAYVGKTGEIVTGTYDLGGATLEIPNSASDQTLTNAGEFGINTTDEQLSVHSAADGEISGETSISFIKTYSITFDPDAVCDGTIDALYLFQVGDDYPEGIIIDEWKISFSQDPTTELDADLSRASTIIGQTSEADIDALDTTNGVAVEDTDANINGGAVVANGQYIYIEFVTPYTATGEQIMFQMWYHGEED